MHKFGVNKAVAKTNARLPQAAADYAHMQRVAGLREMTYDFQVLFTAGFLVCLQPCSVIDVHPSRLIWDCVCVCDTGSYLPPRDEQWPTSVCQYMSQTHDIGNSKLPVVNSVHSDDCGIID